MAKARKKAAAPPPSIAETLRLKRRSEAWQARLIERCAAKWGHPFHAETQDKPASQYSEVYRGKNIGFIHPAIVLRDDACDVVRRSEPDTRKRQIGIRSLCVLITRIRDGKCQLANPTHPHIEKMRLAAEAFLSACVFTPKHGDDAWVQLHSELNRAIHDAIPVAKLRNPDTAFIETITMGEAEREYGIVRSQFSKACNATPPKIRRTSDGKMRLDDVKEYVAQAQKRKQSRLKSAK